jgi:hypothetical protein
MEDERHKNPQFTRSSAPVTDYIGQTGRHMSTKSLGTSHIPDSAVGEHSAETKHNMQFDETAIVTASTEQQTNNPTLRQLAL